MGWIRLARGEIQWPVLVNRLVNFGCNERRVISYPAEVFLACYQELCKLIAFGVPIRALVVVDRCVTGIVRSNPPRGVLTFAGISLCCDFLGR